MLFSSIIFIFYFLPLFLIGYYASGWRTGALLVGSAVFYTWGEGAYVLLLAGLIVVNWAGGLAVARAGRGRGLWLAALIVLDLGVLGYFKYAGFLAQNLNVILPGHPLPSIVQRLPLGISFFTFQLISYAVDVHRGAVKVERDPLKFAAYILMFPHLIAGPIVRYAHIRDEMHGDRARSRRVGLGIQYFIVGLSQKVLVANSVAHLADYAFGLPAGLDATTAWLGALAYALQIYFDFAGYSNMAIGLAFLLGFTFPKNFDHPYASASVTEFWRRWHMSLSGWFRDYVYIPLGGNRGGRWRTVRNLMIVFLLTGFWHGAAWTFVLWGLYHGAFLMLERFGLGGLLARAPRPVGHLYALLVVLGGWVLFRAADLPHALAYLHAMAGASGWTAQGIGLARTLNLEVVAALVLGVAFAGPLAPAMMARLGRPIVGRAEQLEPRLDTVAVHPMPVWLLAAGLVLSVALLTNASLNPFLYFRF
ncbi:MBOAT family protein [Phenylobacterium aquaticum]|uniref:MBOAT family O-acyltransferase n=1 Tax=Phenylobacterium aquaticum TaxID=1763816 RepID=UPI0026EE3775|nr:MBOAT family protein [Phenylobacterium aquaticum]